MENNVAIETKTPLTNNSQSIATMTEGSAKVDLARWKILALPAHLQFFKMRLLNFDGYMS